MIHFTADTHFWHKNQADRRGFATVEDMHEHLIKQWNARVGPAETVYHLGDLSFAGFSRTLEVVSRLNGKIKIVPGNHDDPATLRRLEESLPDGLFEVLPPLYTLKANVNRGDGTNDVHRFVLCHFPLLVWDRAHYGAMHLHGHSHGNLIRPGGKVLSEDVGVDCSEFLAPFSLDVVLQQMAGRKWVGHDHHTEKREEVDPCPGCPKGVICRTPACKRPR